MTRKEAEAEAQRRWGQDAFAEANRAKREESMRHLGDRRNFVFVVGVRRRQNVEIRGTYFKGVSVAIGRGWGDSYAAAFADADRREELQMDADAKAYEDSLNRSLP